MKTQTFTELSPAEATAEVTAALAALNIAALVIHDCGAAEPLNEGGEFRATVTVEEFKPIVPKAVSASPVLSNTIPTVTITGFVLTPADVQANAALTQQLGIANNGLPQPVGPWNPSLGGLPP